MSAAKYFQFPICVFSINEESRNIMNYIVAYGLVEAGVAVRRSMKAEEVSEGLERFGLLGKDLAELELEARLGAELLNITLGSTWAAWYERFLRHKQVDESFHGKSPLVRIRADIVMEVLAGGRMTWREFRVVAGIYSVIGAKPYPVMIRQSMIEARSNGYAGPADLARARAMGFSPQHALTPKQVRVTIEKVWLLKWFARVTPDPHGRATYYSHRLTEDEMIEKIFEKRSYKAAFLQAARQKSQALVERLAAVKATAASSPVATSSPARKKQDGAIPMPQRDEGDISVRRGENVVPSLGRGATTAGVAGRRDEGVGEGAVEGCVPGATRAPLIESHSKQTPHIETPAIKTPDTNTLSTNPASTNQARERPGCVEMSDADGLRPRDRDELHQFLNACHPEYLGLCTVEVWDHCHSLHASFERWARS